LTNRGNTTLTSTDINWETLSDSKWFHITSLEGNLDLLEQLVGFAYENKIKISLNPGNRELHQPKLLLPLLKYIDFFLLNTTESETLVGRPFDQDGFLDQILSYGPKTIAVTNGRNGAYVATSQEKIFSPIINTTPVDETGAGDSFGSAFVAAQIYGKNIHQSLDWAVHNSASVVSHLGSKPGLLTLNQLK
jgi:sugar/nucleoside kinase (ribokinase family)